MRYLILILALSGCSTIKEYWPRPHDPILVDYIVRSGIAIDIQDCTKPTWDQVRSITRPLKEYAELRGDPQRVNLTGLDLHIERLAQGGSKMFCELGKSSAQQRIKAAKSAVESR